MEADTHTDSRVGAGRLRFRLSVDTEHGSWATDLGGVDVERLRLSDLKRVYYSINHSRSIFDKLLNRTIVITK